MSAVGFMELKIDQALLQAIEAHRSGELQDAERLYRGILQVQPQHPDANYYLGVLAVEAGQPGAALTFLKKALEKNPKHEKYWASYVDTLIKADHFNTARQVLQQGKHNGFEGGAVDELERLLSTQNPSQDKINALVNLYHSDEMVKTEQACRKLLQAYPQSLVVINVLGLALQGQGKSQEAVESYDRAIQLSPDYAVAYFNRGIALQKLGQLYKAVESYDKAIQLKSDYAAAYCNRGNALKDYGLPEMAVESYEKAIQIKPDNAEAYSNRGTALQEMGQLDKAVESHEKAIQLKPDNAAMQYNRYALLLDPDDLMPAIMCMERAVEIDPSNVNHRFILGMLWDYYGDTQKATNHFDMVEKETGLYRANLDAWYYIKSVNNKVPTIIGSSIQTFRLGIDAANVDGLVLEFGVRFGASIRQIAALVDQNVHGFDSFQGLPESWHHEPEGSYSTNGVIPSVPENVTLHDGWFEETIPEFVKKHPEPVRFMNIDCDLYSSTKTILEHFSKQIISGTVIVFDEYIGNENWREDEFKAFQEAVLQHGWEYEYLCFSFMTKQVAVRIS